MCGWQIWPITFIAPQRTWPTWVSSSDAYAGSSKALERFEGSSTG